MPPLLYDAAGRPLDDAALAGLVAARERAPKGVLSTVAPAPFNDRFQTRAGANLTPRYILNCLQNADQGLMYHLVDILEEALEMDGHLQAVVEKRVDWVAASKWEVVANGSSPVALEAAEFCKDVLENAMGNGDNEIDFRQLIAHCQMATYYPAMCAEAIWKKPGRWVVIDHWNSIHPRRLAFATDWSMHIWNQLPGGPIMGEMGDDRMTQRWPGMNVADYPKGKFVRHRALIRPGGYPTRDGVGRLTVWFAAFKRWTVRDLMAFAEQFARGLRSAQFTQNDFNLSPNAAFGKNERGATDEDVVAMKAALSQWSSAVSLVYPSSFDKLNIQHTQGTGVEIYRMGNELFEAQMSKAVLGSTLSTDPGRKGARSLGDVHVDGEERRAAKDAQNIARTIRRDVLAPLLAHNFREGVPVPNIVFQTPSVRTRIARIRMVNNAAISGMQVPAAWAHAETGIPVPKTEVRDGVAQTEPLLIPSEKLTTQ